MLMSDHHQHHPYTWLMFDDDWEIQSINQVTSLIDVVRWLVDRQHQLNPTTQQPRQRYCSLSLSLYFVLVVIVVVASKWMFEVDDVGVWQCVCCCCVGRTTFVWWWWDRCATAANTTNNTIQSTSVSLSLSIICIEAHTDIDLKRVMLPSSLLLSNSDESV